MAVSPMSPPAMTPTLPATDLLCGRYRLESLLGRGGMADVYLATDATGGPAVAVKLVRSTDPELARRLAREADAVARFDHPGLVRLLGTEVVRDQAFLVMELVDGPALSTVLRRGPLSPSRCAVLGTSLADALAYVHGEGIVHRDVKPSNVLLGPGLRVRLADFGIAQLVDTSSLTLTGTTLGTAAYMAPEQLEHHRVGPAADVWALGVVLLECMTGRRGFEGSATEVMARRMAGAAPSSDDLPTPWRILVASMLDHDPARRPEASEVAEILPSPAFARPWKPDAMGPGPTAKIPRSDTALVDVGLASGSPGADPTDRARQAGGGPSPYGDPPSTKRRRYRRVITVLVVLALIALGLGVSHWALSAHPKSPRRAANSSSTTSTNPTTTSPTTTSPTTTTTVAPSPGGASAALARDVQQGESAGTLSSDVGTTILDQLGQALAAGNTGATGQASSAVAAMEGAVAGAAQSGQASPAEAATLMGDVAALATALNVPAPTTTSTASGDTTSPPAHHGHH